MKILPPLICASDNQISAPISWREMSSPTSFFRLWHESAERESAPACATKLHYKKLNQLAQEPLPVPYIILASTTDESLP